MVKEKWACGELIRNSVYTLIVMIMIRHTVKLTVNFIISFLIILLFWCPLTRKRRLDIRIFAALILINYLPEPYYLVVQWPGSLTSAYLKALVNYCYHCDGCLKQTITCMDEMVTLGADDICGFQQHQKSPAKADFRTTWLKYVPERYMLSL